MAFFTVQLLILNEINFGEKAARDTGDVKVNSDVNSGIFNHCLFVAHDLVSCSTVNVLLVDTII